MRRVATLLCCLSLGHVCIAAANDAPPKRPAPLTLAVVSAAPQSGPIRKASLNRDSVRTFIGETGSAARSRQGTDPSRDSWIERHPVWTGALVGFSAGVVLTYVMANDNDAIISTGAAATFWGGVSAGSGALIGWGIGRNRDDH